MFMVALGAIRMSGTVGAFASAAPSETLIGKLARAIRHRIGQQLAYQRAMRELRRLDDRDLDDLAIGRDDFTALAWSHVRAAG